MRRRQNENQELAEMRLREEEENLRSFVDEVIATTSQESGVTRDEPAMPPPSK